MFTGQTGGQLTIIVYFIVLALIYYVLLIMPQRRRLRERQNLIQNLRKNSEVITVGGVYGTVKEIRDEYVMLEVAKDVRIKVAKEAVGSIAAQPGKEEKPAKSEAKATKATDNE